MPSSSTSVSSSCSSTSSGEVESPFALLESLEAAIIAVATGHQSYRLGDRTVTRADLADLIKARDILKSEVAQALLIRPAVSASSRHRHWRHQWSCTRRNRRVGLVRHGRVKETVNGRHTDNSRVILPVQ